MWSDPCLLLTLIYCRSRPRSLCSSHTGLTPVPRQSLLTLGPLPEPFPLPGMFRPDFFLSFGPPFHVTISDRPSLSVCMLPCFHIYLLIVISDCVYPEPVSHVGSRDLGRPGQHPEQCPTQNSHARSVRGRVDADQYPFGSLLISLQLGPGDTI